MLKKNIIANYIGQGWVALIGFAFIPLYIKYLGIEAFGLIGVFAVIQLWLGLLDMGLSVTLSREFASFSKNNKNNSYINDLLRSAEYISLGIGVSVILIIYTLSDLFIINWLNLEKISFETAKISILVISVVMALRFIEVIYRSTIVGLQKQVTYNLISSIMATIRSTGALLALIYISPTLEVFFITQLVGSLFTVIIFRIVVYRSMPKINKKPIFSSKILYDIKNFTAGTLLFNILNILLTQVDKLILMKLLPLSEYGSYTLAATLSSSLFILIGPIIQAIYPKICELHSKNENLHFSDTYHKASKLISIFFGSAAIVMIFNAELILNIWTQDEILSSNIAPLLAILALGNLLNGLLWLPFQAQLATGWTRLLIQSNTIAVVLIIPMIIYVTPRFGTIGAAWVWVLLNIGYLLVTIHLMHKKILIHEKITWFLYDCSLPLISGILTTLLLKIIFQWVFFNELNNYIKLFTYIIFVFFSTALSTDIFRNFARNKYSYLITIK
jgi:O-antigen/teichoic acid export membrane protein